jgi:TatD DNase family protein
VALSASECPTLLVLATEFPKLRPCFGIHPQSVVDYATSHAEISESTVAIELCQEMERLIIENKAYLAGIGECGLDFSLHLANSDRIKAVRKRYCKFWTIDRERLTTDYHFKIQRLVLEEHAKWSKEHSLTLNVHSRSAGKPTIDLLQKANATRVLLHAFDGRPAYAQQAARIGWKLSVPASTVRSDAFQKMVGSLPLEALCLETDAPALHPVKGPNLINTPSSLVISAAEIARIHKITFKQVAEATTETAKKLFQLDASV